MHTKHGQSSQFEPQVPPPTRTSCVRLEVVAVRYDGRRHVVARPSGSPIIFFLCLALGPHYAPVQHSSSIARTRMRSELRGEQPTATHPRLLELPRTFFLFFFAIVEGCDVLQLRPRGFHPVFGGVVEPIGVLLQLRQPGRPRVGDATPGVDAGRKFSGFGLSAHGGVSAGGFVYYSSFGGGRGAYALRKCIQSKRDYCTHSRLVLR